MNSFDSRAQSVYPANPATLPPAPRRIEITLGAQVKRVSLWVCLLLGPTVVYVIGYQSADDFRQLRDSGVETNGKVESRWVWGEYDGTGPTYHVNYIFYVAGQLHVKQLLVTESEYVQMNEGKSIRITYLPSDPTINCHESPGRLLDIRIGLTVIVAALIAVGFGGGATWFEWTVQREVRLATFGVGSVGQIIDKGIERRSKYPCFWTRYEFISPTTKRATNWQYVPQVIWELIPCGQDVTVLYDPECPSRHLPLYAFKHVRIKRVPVPTPDILDPAFDEQAVSLSASSGHLSARLK